MNLNINKQTHLHVFGMHDISAPNPHMALNTIQECSFICIKNRIYSVYGHKKIIEIN